MLSSIKSLDDSQSEYSLLEHVRELHYYCVKEEWDKMDQYIKTRSFSIIIDENDLNFLTIKGINATLKRLKSSISLLHYLAFIAPLTSPKIIKTPYIREALDYSLTIEEDTSSIFKTIFSNNITNLLCFALREVFFTFSSSFVEFALLYLINDDNDGNNIEDDNEKTITSILSTLLEQCNNSSSIEMFIKLLLNFNHKPNEIIEIVMSLHDKLSPLTTSPNLTPYPLEACKSFYRILDKFISIETDQWNWFKDLLETKLQRYLETHTDFDCFPCGAFFLARKIGLSSFALDRFPFKKESFIFLWKESFYSDAILMLKTLKTEHYSFFRSFIASLNNEQFCLILQSPIVIQHLPNQPSTLRMFELSLQNPVYHSKASLEVGISFFTKIFRTEAFSTRKAEILSQLLILSIQYNDLSSIHGLLTSSTSLYSPNNSWIIERQPELPIYLLLKINQTIPFELYSPSSPTRMDYLLSCSIYQIVSLKCHLEFEGADDLLLLKIFKKPTIDEAFDELKDFLLPLPAYRAGFILSFLKRTLFDSLKSFRVIPISFLTNVLLLYSKGIGPDLPELGDVLELVNLISSTSTPTCNSVAFLFTLGIIGMERGDLLFYYDSLLEKLLLSSLQITGHYSFVDGSLCNFTLVKISSFLFGGDIGNFYKLNNLTASLLQQLCHSEYEKYLLDFISLYSMDNNTMIKDPDYRILSLFLFSFLQRPQSPRTLSIYEKFLKLLDPDFFLFVVGDDDGASGGDNDNGSDLDLMDYMDDLDFCDDNSNFNNNENSNSNDTKIDIKPLKSDQQPLTKEDLLLKIAISHDSNFISKEPWLPRYSSSGTWLKDDK